MNDSYRLYADMTTDTVPRVLAEISTEALVGNYIKLTEGLPSHVRPCCVVKADAYGHSAHICVPALIDAGCRFFAVSSVEEAVDVRKICLNKGTDADILILGYSAPENADIIRRYDIIQACVSAEYAEELSRHLSSGRIRIHVKLDTGMNRIGFPTFTEEDRAASLQAIQKAASLPGIKTEGAFSHFARADEDSPAARAATALQTERFEKMTSAIEAAGIALPVKHICNTAGTAKFTEYHGNAVRLGIGLYGMDPSPEVRLNLEPVLKLKATVTQVHTLRKGESVGYGGTFTSERDMKLATLPIGYADGFVRAYRGARASVYSPEGTFKGTAVGVGRICMDQCMFDVTDINLEPGDIAVLMGEPGQVDALAALAGTINYECTCILSSRVLRIKADSH